MADQTEPQENRRYSDQPLNADNQAGQNMPPAQSPAQHFAAPAESFGSFGPLPNAPTNTPDYNEPPSTPAGLPGNPYAPMPTTANPYPANSAPGNPYAPTVANPYSATPVPGYPSTQGYPYTPGMPGALPYTPYGIYPPYPATLKTRKPIHFPLTRKAPVLLQVFGMLLYSLVMALSIMGCALTLLRAYVDNANVYSNLDGSINGLSILLTCVIALVLVPACSLFCGVFFGSWRGLIVSLLAVIGGFLIAHVTDSRFGNPNASWQSYLPFASLPVTALVVGLVYARRKYAAWWKSMFTMLLGTAVLILWIFVCIYSIDTTSSNLTILAANAHETQQNYLATVALGFGCIALVIIPLLGLLFAGIEGIIHSIIARALPAS